jgi:ribosomal protein L11
MEMVWLNLETSGEVTSNQINEIINILEKDYKNLYLIGWHGMAWQILMIAGSMGIKFIRIRQDNLIM